MPAKQLRLVPKLPIFDIPDKYKDDEWSVKEWDIYKNAPAKRRSDWNLRSKNTDNVFKFSLCSNPFIAEEFKYFMYHLIEVKRVTITTFSEYYDRYKILSTYVNTYMADSESILELEDLSLFEFYLSTQKKAGADEGIPAKFISQEFQRASKKSRFSTFLTYAQSIIKQYYEKDLPETKKTIWHPNRFPFCKGLDADKTLDFSIIKNPVTMKNVQDFCLHKLHAITFNAVYAYLFDIKLFIRWLDENHPLNKLSDLTRDILEEYFIWVRTSSGYNSHKANVSILNLKVFLDWGQLLEKKDMPDQPLIMRNDYVLKTKKESRYLTDSEVKGLLNVLPQMPKLYGRMVYCLLFLGMRFSELAKLDVNAIKKNDDDTYYLDLWQYKTQAVNEKPVFENTLKIMAAEIERNKKRFGEDNVKYVFVTDQNTPVANGTLNDNINKVLTKNNVLGRDGKILHVTTHRFRATVATNLISEGVSVDVAAQLLGQTTLSSLSHYATVANDVVKEQLKPRLEKDEMLIRNIGKGKDMAEVIPEKSVALCNGYCGKSPLTTPCAKANACFNCSMFIPSIQFLNAYHIQLLEIEATIKVAEANNYDMMLKKALREKVALEKIIEKLEKGDRKNDS
ncbi:MAG: site-specific integrase [Lachnospiraceae bacterium]|jgi:site-specific recombinase XerD|nr:site-specific integrase [Lachnospiraceae bacterium]